MNEQQAQELLKRFRDGLCSEQESAAIEAWIEKEQSSGSWNISPADKAFFGQSLKKKIDEAIADDDKDIFKQLPVIFNQLSLTYRVRWAVAASLLLFFSIGVYFISSSSRDKPLSLTSYKYITPGTFKATLTLSGGRRIVLSNAKNGILATQGSTIIHKTAEGGLEYSAKTSLSAIAFDTVTTPISGQYRITLSDGTLVWLNSASSISFPEAFKGNSRAVTITGEAYFEVAHNKQKPFLVTAGSQTVEVLGTHFNVNAYTDEPVLKTTLLEGSVKVSKGNNTVMIKPGEEASLAPNTNTFTISRANIERAVAWTNGNFVFDHDNIQSIMRQISRWYNVDVAYQGNMAHKDFVGSVSRFGNVAEVLNTLQLTGTVHFKIEERRITVIAK